MKEIKRELLITMIFVLLSIILYSLNFAIFHDRFHIFMYGMGELAFLPLEVLIVTVVLNRLLEWRDQKALLSKQSMLIGSFFSEIGITMLRKTVAIDSNSDTLKKSINNISGFKKQELNIALKAIDNYVPGLKVSYTDLKLFKDLILPKRQFLSNLIQHPILLEHKAFTDLLLATNHLTEELSYRNSLDNIPQNDRNHLVKDIERIYKQLLPEWVKYISNLKEQYPYLYSLYVRLNPFDENYNVTIN